MSEKSRQPEVIFLRESVLASIVRDFITFVTFAAMVGLGVFLESSAMQWTGAIIFFLVCLNRAKSLLARGKMTVAEARKKLDEIEGQS